MRAVKYATQLGNLALRTLRRNGLATASEGRLQAHFLREQVPLLGNGPSTSGATAWWSSSASRCFPSRLSRGADAFLKRNSEMVEVQRNLLTVWRTTLVGLIDSSSGQKLLSVLLPTAAMAALFPSRFQCIALEQPTQFRRKVLPPPPYSFFSYFTMPALLRLIIEEFHILVRAMYLMLLFTPVIVTAPLVFLMGVGAEQGREQWMDLIRNTMAAAGPAWIKWSQWAATRPDLFPEDLCSSLEKLQTQAPAHGGMLSRQSIEAAFSHPVEQLFDAFEDEPVASGSIAQIHRAKLGALGAAATGYKKGSVVAVKVRHPGVTELMESDFKLMQRAAHMAGMLPGLSELRLEESIRQFGGPLKEQLDLVMEARNLDRFKRNFRSWNNVSFPSPLYPFVSSDVLVETFEDGELISGIVEHADGYMHRASLAQMGLDLYLQMLFKDNFLHADLHPGNILVKEVDPRQFGLSHSLASWFVIKPKLVLLDVGMIAELRPQDQRNLVEFFSALTRQDGERLGRSILKLSEAHTCRDPESFVVAMKDMFDRLDPVTIRQNTNRVFKDMIEKLRQYKVTLQSEVSTVVVTALVLEGWSNKLDPDLHILDTMRDLLATDWSDRICRVVDRIMANGGIAVV